MISKNELYHLYIKQMLSTRAIGKLYNMSHTPILKLLRKYDIPRRSCSRASTVNKKPFKPSTNLYGNRYGKLVVVDYETGGYICQCDCGNKVQMRAGRFTRDGVKSCGCSWHPIGPDSSNWKGYGELSSKQFSSIKSDAAKRDLPFDITIQEA